MGSDVFNPPGNTVAGRLPQTNDLFNDFTPALSSLNLWLLFLSIFLIAFRACCTILVDSDCLLLFLFILPSFRNAWMCDDIYTKSN